MQPTLVITSPAAGLVHINGRITGETGPDNPIIMPITPNGTIYLHFFPLGRRYRPGTYRLSASSGNISKADDTSYLISWPGNIYEISLMPLTAVPQESEFSMIDGIPAAILRGEASLLRIGQHSVALPDGASLPDIHTTANGAEIYMGACGKQRYLAAFASDSLLPLGTIVADAIDLSADSTIAASTALHDTAGHTRIDTYSASQAALEHTSTTYTFGENGRIRPSDAEQAALAAAEAVLLGLNDEAANYLSGSLTTTQLSDILNGVDTVIAIKYSIPGAHPAIGLVSRTGSHTASVIPLYYKSTRAADGSWRITAFKKEKEDLM